MEVATSARGTDFREVAVAEPASGRSATPRLGARTPSQSRPCDASATNRSEDSRKLLEVRTLDASSGSMVETESAPAEELPADMGTSSLVEVPREWVSRRQRHHDRDATMDEMQECQDGLPELLPPSVPRGPHSPRCQH